MRSHDHSYKHLFSHREMVADLLTGFVNQPWVQELDLTSLEKLNASYITDDLRERADDVVWRVRFRDEWLYVYLLIEFQSTVDNFMAVRLLTYVGLLYQDLIKSKQLPVPNALPPVFPIVLYNGARPWRAAEELSSLIQPVPAELQAYQPTLRYLLINENGYSEEVLATLRNLVATLFQLENSATIEGIARLVGNLAIWLKAPEQQSLSRAFAQWLNGVIPTKAAGQTIDTVHDLLEMQTMLAERVKGWTEEWKREGLEEGLEKGKADLLKLQLTKRFGALPVWATEKLDAADSPQLDIWAGRIFDAQSLESLFEPTSGAI